MLIVLQRRKLEPIMKSLAQMHQAGLIHRDISPYNILVYQYKSVTE
ncbi:MAG: lipopolysaccharide kinase InaA family protein [Lachnospiraceae bacterium]|nr:hypothetical protein [Lachnospiraceae bacterium]MDD7437025.1 lipopolysaccharide kinase InaA family protein [Lachnospiraceae bacterium]